MRVRVRGKAYRLDIAVEHQMVEDRNREPVTISPRAEQQPLRPADRDPR